MRPFKQWVQSSRDLWVATITRHILKRHQKKVQQKQVHTINTRLLWTFRSKTLLEWYSWCKILHLRFWRHRSPDFRCFPLQFVWKVARVGTQRELTWSCFPKKCHSVYQHYVCIERKSCQYKKKNQPKRTSRRHRIILYLNLNHIVHDDIVSIKQTLHTKPMVYNNEIPVVDHNKSNNDMNKNRIIVVVITISHPVFLERV